MIDRLQQALNRLLAFFQRRPLDTDLDAEVASHLEFAIEENIQRGMCPEEARREARIRFGGVLVAKERQREARGIRSLDILLQDLRYAVRQLRRNPGFATTAMIVLALGVAATVSIFAFVDAALLRPLPYANPTRLVGVTEKIAIFNRANLSIPDYYDWKRSNTVFNSMDVYTGSGYLLPTPEGAKPVLGTRVSDGFFRTLGVSPMLGRDFYPGEDRPEAPHTVILSHATWRNRFGARRDIVGQNVDLSGVSFTIIGVLPPEFQFAPRASAEFWTTLHPSQDPKSCDARRSCHSLEGVARLKDGVSVETARAEMEKIAKDLEIQYPDSNRGQGASVEPLSEIIIGNIRPILLMLLCGSGLLLLIACVNVSSLLLVRSEARRREIAVRSALGASIGRLTRQFTTEGLVLVAASSIVGVFFARIMMQLMTKLIPENVLEQMPYLTGLSLNWRVLTFAGTISILAVVLFSITPILRLRFMDIREGLSESGGRTGGTVWRRLGANLVTVELALAVVLLVSAALLGKSLHRLLRVDLGFVPDHVATLQVVAPKTTYNDARVVQLARTIVDRVSALPGVTSVAVANRIALSGNGNTTWIRIVGHPYNGEHNEVNEREVGAQYFQTLRAQLIRGRYFRDDEDASKPNVVIINRALAQKYFPGEDPIGKKMGDTELSQKSIAEVVGIVDDIREGSLDSEIMPAAYYPFNQGPDQFFALVVRTSQPEQLMLPTLGAAIRELDANIGTTGEQTMISRANDSQSAYLRRSSAWLAGGFAAVALSLAIVGLYGVIAYSVSQRTREIGVRMALGAQRSSVYRLILKEAGVLTTIGVFVGLLCSILAATLMRTMLFEVRSWDLPTLAAVAAVLAVSALLASYFPARRAVSVNPVEALRAE